MMKLARRLALPLTLLFAFSISGCDSGGGDSPPPTGSLNVTIVDGSDGVTGIAGANVLLLDGAGDPVNNFTSDANGAVPLQTLLTGSYLLRVSAQDFSPSPAPTIPPLPVSIAANQTTDIVIRLYPLAVDSRGTISGSVANTSGGSVAGALIVATFGGNSITTISADDGSYVLHNVPVGDSSLTAFISGLNFPTLTPVAVADGVTTTDQNIVANSNAAGSISGSVNFVAGAVAVPADVTLLHPITREVIPGMRVYTDAGNNYVMSGMPDGHFEIIASLENDGNVLDPDLAVTQGTPVVDITAGVVVPATKDFKVTGAVELDTPATPVDNIIPELSATPTFTWHSASSYSSLDEYVIEVVDESGDTIWGGFDPLTGQPSVTVLKTDTLSIKYNVDSTAVSALEAGRSYQLRIYAINYVAIDLTYPDGIQTLSTTENLDGIFRVELPAAP